MTAARAERMRVARIEGRELSNRERREAEAEAKAAEAGRPTISRLWAQYLEANPDIKGRVTDENRFFHHLKPVFGETTPGEIAPLDLDRFRIRLLKARAPGTVKNILELLRRIINFGVDRGLCPAPALKIKVPSPNNEKTEDLTPEQLKRLMEAIEADYDQQVKGLMLMALYSGMRRGELFRLKWDHIDFERGFIRLVDTKGGKDQVIPLNEAARQVLEEHPRGRSPFVFPGRKGGQRKEARRGLNRIKRAADLPDDFRPLHGLRHVYASMLASSGQVDLYTLQRLLTHKSPMMTQRYAHLRDESLRKASDLAGEIVAEARNGGVAKNTTRRQK